MVHELRKVSFSCVVDALPRFYVQALIWYWTLEEFVKVPVEDLYIHYTPGCDGQLIEYFRRQGINTIEVLPFSKVSPPCNKLRQLETTTLQRYEYIVLSDCDKVYSNMIRSWLKGDSLLACHFVARPPFRVFERLYSAAGFGSLRPVVRPLDVKEDVPDPRTPLNNVNGGTYIVPQAVFAKLAEIWPKWANWLLERTELLETWVRNLDQVSLCLALEELNIDVTELPKYFDYGVNVSKVPFCGQDPMDMVGAIHYHNSLTRRGMIARGPKCNPVIATRIDAVNALLARRASECNLFGELVGQLVRTKQTE